MVPLPPSLCLSSLYRPCSGDHNATARVTTRPWWRVLVGGMFGGARRGVQGGGFGGQEKSVSACPTLTRRRLRVPPSFLKGVGCIPPQSLPRTGGNPRPSPGSSGVVIFSLLKVMLGIRHLGVLGAWWYFSGGRSGCGVILVFVNLPVLALVSFIFLFVWARLCCGPSCFVVSIGCYNNIGGRKPILRRECEGFASAWPGSASEMGVAKAH